MTRLCHLP